MTKRFRDLSPVLAAFFFVVAVVEALAWSHWFTADAAEAADAKIKLVKNVWLMEVKDGPVTPEQQKVNLDYQAQLEDKGIKIIGGSVKDINTGKRVNGLVFVHANSRAEAQALVDADPGVKNGSRIITLREFEWNSGTMGVQIHFGDAAATTFR